MKVDKAMKITISILMFLMFSFSTFGQENMTFLKNWKTYPVPTNKDTIRKYNSAKSDWMVYYEEDEIRVDDIRNLKINPIAKLPFDVFQSSYEVKDINGEKHIIVTGPEEGGVDVVEVKDGYLIGFNRGEWGGDLYWFSKNGKEKYKISGHQIVQFIKRDNKIYAIEGLAHLSMSRGSIIEIEKKEGKWITKEFLKLPTAPEVIQLDSKENFIVVTFGTDWSFDKGGKSVIHATPGLFSIDRKANIVTLVKDGIWGDDLYPSSMVIQNDVVYIGMRKGVYKFDLVTKRDEWLLPE